MFILPIIISKLVFNVSNEIMIYQTLQCKAISTLYEYLDSVFCVQSYQVGAQTIICIIEVPRFSCQDSNSAEQRKINTEKMR